MRNAILKSSVQFGDIDYGMALQYLFIVGGAEMLSKAGLGRLCPKWKGDRADLVSLGGKKSRNKSNWLDSKREIWDSDEKKIMAMVVEVLTNLVMSTHVYSFAGKFYLQRDGGPIGLRSTACIPALIMKLWDITM